MNLNKQDGLQYLRQEETNRKIKINSAIFLGGFFLMIIMTVINGNKYVAAIAFTWIPLYLLAVCSLVYLRNFNRFDRFATLAILVGLSALVSTLFSDVVGIENCRGILSYTICYAIITTVSLSEKDFRRLIWFYLYFCLALSLILLFNYVFSIGVSSANRVSIQYAGMRKDSNYLSSFIVPSFGVYLYFGFYRGRARYFVYAVLTFIALFLAGSRASFLTMLAIAVIVTIHFIFVSKRISIARKVLLILLLIVATGVLYYFMSRSAIFTRTTDFDNYENNARLLIWNCALEGFYRKPFIGSGSMSGTYFSQMHVRWVTHSCYISLISAQGIVGVLLILSMWIGYFKVRKENFLLNAIILISFFFPLMFIDGYEGANFWIPMMLCRFISDKARDNKNLMDILI